MIILSFEIFSLQVKYCVLSISRNVKASEEALIGQKMQKSRKENYNFPYLFLTQKSTHLFFLCRVKISEVPLKMYKKDF